MTEIPPTPTFDFRWGVAWLDKAREGGADVPGFVLRNYHKLGITPQEMMLIIHLAAYHYNSPKGKARPSLKTIAELMGYKKDDSVRRMVLALEERGLVAVTRDPGTMSTYDFKPLATKCLELDAESDVSDEKEVPHSSGVPHSDGREVPHHSGDEDQEYKTKKERSKPVQKPKVAPPDTTTPAPKRNPGYDMVATEWFGKALDSAGFQALGGRIGQHAHWVNGNTVTVKRKDDNGETQTHVIPPPCARIQPGMLADIRRRLYPTKDQDKYKPLDFLKFVEVVDAELAKLKPPAPDHVPLSDEDKAALRDAQFAPSPLADALRKAG